MSYFGDLLKAVTQGKEVSAGHEGLKIIGALAWVFGLVMLFVAPLVGVFVLVIALLISILSTQKTRENRHEEIVKAAEKIASPPKEAARPAADDVAEQLRKLAELRDAGVVSEEEFTVKKQELLDRM